MGDGERNREWLDGLFEPHRDKQYTRELLFSTVVDLMALVALVRGCAEKLALTSPELERRPVLLVTAGTAGQ